MNGHELFRMRQRLKAKRRIKSVGISCSQQKPPQSLQLWVREHGTNEHLRYATTAMLRHDKNIRDVGYRGKIRDDSGEPDLLPVAKRAKT